MRRAPALSAAAVALTTALSGCNDSLPVTPAQTCETLRHEVDRNETVLNEVISTIHEYQNALANAPRSPVGEELAQRYRLAIAKARIFLFHADNTPNDILTQLMSVFGHEPHDPLKIQIAQQDACAVKDAPTTERATAAASVSR